MRRKKLANPYNIAPLVIEIERRVRFEELDPMGIMWHGRYTSWFEDGREAIGKRYGISYMDFYQHGYMAPIKRLEIDFHRPLVHDRSYRIRSSLLWNEAARIDFSYEILNEEGELFTEASSVQLFTDLTGELLVDFPDHYKKFLAQWKAGTLL